MEEERKERERKKREGKEKEKKRKERRLDSRRIPEDQRESIRRAASSHTPLPPPPSPVPAADERLGSRGAQMKSGRVQRMTPVAGSHATKP